MTTKLEQAIDDLKMDLLASAHDLTNRHAIVWRLDTIDYELKQLKQQIQDKTYMDKITNEQLETILNFDIRTEYSETYHGWMWRKPDGTGFYTNISPNIYLNSYDWAMPVIRQINALQCGVAIELYYGGNIAVLDYTNHNRNIITKSKLWKYGTGQDGLGNSYMIDELNAMCQAIIYALTLIQEYKQQETGK